MKIRAKMQVQTVTKHAYGSEVVKLNAVCGGSPEDNTYAKFSPVATLEITIDNPAAQNVLQAGKSYYVDFTRVKDPPPVPIPGA